MESEPQPEALRQFVRVEVDEEHKRFTKQCDADGCTAEFTTSVPKHYFENPDDPSTALKINGQGRIAGTDILAADITEHIFNRQLEHPHTSPSPEIEP